MWINKPLLDAGPIPVAAEQQIQGEWIEDMPVYYVFQPTAGEAQAQQIAFRTVLKDQQEAVHVQIGQPQESVVHLLSNN